MPSPSLTVQAPLALTVLRALYSLRKALTVLLLAKTLSARTPPILLFHALLLLEQESIGFLL